MEILQVELKTLNDQINYYQTAYENSWNSKDEELKKHSEHAISMIKTLSESKNLLLKKVPAKSVKSNFLSYYFNKNQGIFTRECKSENKKRKTIH